MRFVTVALFLALLAPSAHAGRVVVIGFDGADARLTEEYMAAGLLPTLSRLRETGAYGPLGTTTPPQTPVSWSSFATGLNPGRTAIFDFLRRDLRTYQPDFAMYNIGSARVLWGKHNRWLVALALVAVGCVLGGLAAIPRGRRSVRFLGGVTLGVVAAGASLAFVPRLLPFERPTVENTRRGDTFWEVAAREGKRSTIVRVPATFPPRGFEAGHLLAGLGVPDMRGTFGTFSYYTTEHLPEQLDANTEMGGKVVQISLTNGATETVIYGPRNRPYGNPSEEILLPLHIQMDRASDPPRVTVTASGHTQTVTLGTWSDWHPLEFVLSPLVRARGMARFHFVSAEPFGLYLSSVNLDPHRSPLPLSTPPSWSGALADRFGLYKTIGWGMDTWALNELRIDEATFLADAYATEEKFAEMQRGLLEEGAFDLYVQVFEITDRVAHVFWRLLDPEHPAYDSTLAATYGNAVRDTYVFMDKVLGEVVARLHPDDLLLVCSDHGFHTWHKTANYNTWLVQHGYMTLKNTEPDKEKRLEDLFGQGQFWPNVDWRRTKAYALGLGDLYINVKGREGQGIVLPGEEYERIREELSAELLAWTDPETGDHPVRRVMKREEVYSGFDPDLIPDLLVANSPKYRVSWQTSLGGIPRDVLEVNTRKWSGDHCSLDPEITRGIFFANRPLDTEGISILDLYPTILDALGVTIPGDLDGRTRLTSRP